MADNKPFIIRNDTPHNVEVVAGSLNAKGKKSWVKAGDEDAAGKNAAEHRLDLDQHLESLLSTQSESSASSPVFSNGITEDTLKLSKDSPADNLQKLGADKVADHLKALPTTGASAQHLEAIQADAIKDHQEALSVEKSNANLSSLQKEAAQKAPSLKINQENLAENTQKIGSSSVQDDLQKVALAPVSDHLVKVADEKKSTNVQSIDQPQSSENKAKLEQSKTAANVQTLEQDKASENKAKLEPSKTGVNVQTLEEDKASENKAKLEPSKTGVNVQTLEHDKASENKAKLEQSKTGVNVQTLEQDPSSENKAKLAGTSIKDNVSSAPSDALGSNKQTLPPETAVDHAVQIDAQSVEDNLQDIAAGDASKNEVQIDGTVLDLKHQEKAYSEKMTDQALGLDTNASEDNKALIHTDALASNHQPVDSSSTSDQVVGIDAPLQVEDNQAKIAANSIADRRAKFEDIKRQRSAPTLNTDAVSAKEQEAQVNPTPSVASPPKALKPLSREEQIALARKKKSEEFHGRVEAIKNTVTQLNNQLDKLEDTSLELKKTQF